MLIILLCFVVGIGAGFLLRSHRRLADLAGQLTSVNVCLLLFVLGLSIGVNKALVNNLAGLGLEALVLVVGAVGGSIMFAAIIYRRFYRARSCDRR